MSASRRAFVCLVAALFLLPASQMALGAGSQSLEVKVTPDGYVQVGQTLSVSQSSGSVQVTLLSNVVSGVLATDQSGAPLSYSFGGGGWNLTVYTLGATSVNVLYTTDSLTSKNGTLWTLQFNSKYNSTVVLPAGATLSSMSGTPASVNVTSGSPVVELTAGDWKLTYGVPLFGPTTTATSSATSSVAGPPGIFPPAGQAGYEIGGAVLVVGIATVGYIVYSRRRIPGKGEGLRADDVKVLEFLREKGGKALEPEIRSKFALPKTSGWRQIKRLERMGYVKVSKVGSLNQVELVKDGAGLT